MFVPSQCGTQQQTNVLSFIIVKANLEGKLKNANQ